MKQASAEVRRYLEELSHLLSDVPADLRAEIVGGIREHLAQVESAGDDDAVRDALVRLGSPESVAAAARGDQPPVRRPSLADRWTTIAAGLAALCAADGLLALGVGMAVTARFDENADWNLHPAAVLLGTGLCFLAGLFATILVWPSRSWRRTHKLGVTAIWPVALVVAFAAGEVSLRLPVGAGFAVGAVVLLLGALVTVVIGRWTLEALTVQDAR
ncbi:hypothetical protein HPO96_05815 [Kribbella sandramycini]|uniref:DUF1700 domain-containing protein n=1 Tax=Kribbella sandramycini TaxID=60450 RepID=A0A7Y4NXR8_9ACTN|nr:hypothetical protein [Kribbella sandramycini]MBB6567642.1 hypothetical protein [Kribbella sandramycini]NOL39756.1 hypothetical protein [Kribbella sandramycini]